MLLSEHFRKPITKTEIRKHIFIDHPDRTGKLFKQVLVAANERLKEIAQDDTDWNRRSACVLLIQFDAIKALPFVEPLYMKTTNPNTKAALLAALKEQDGAPLRTAMVQAKSRMLDDLVRPR